MSYELPKSAVIVARVWLAVGAIGILAGSAAALVMRIELWWPGPQTSPRVFDRAWGVHAIGMLVGGLVPAIFAGLGNLFVPSVFRAPRSRSVWLSAFGALPTLAALALLGRFYVLLEESEAAAWIVLGDQGTPLVLALLALGLACTALHFAIVAGTRWRGSGFFGGPLVALLCGALIWRGLELAARAVVILDPELGYAYGPIPDTMSAWTFFPTLAAAFGVAAYASARNVRSASMPTAVLHLAALLPALWLGLLARAFLATVSADVHLHDTYFVTGAFHAHASVLVLALLTGLHGFSVELFGRAPHAWIAGIAAAFLCVGMLGTSIAMMLLGADGMPMRYSDYLDEFMSMHRMIGAGGLVTTVGVLLSLVSIVAGKPSRNARVPVPRSATASG